MPLAVSAVSLCCLVACAVVDLAGGLPYAGSAVSARYMITFTAGIVVLLANSAVERRAVVSCAGIVAYTAVNGALSGTVIINVYAALALIAVVDIAVLAMESGNITMFSAVFSVGELNDYAGAVGTLNAVCAANACLAVILAAKSTEGELAVIRIDSASVNGSYVDMLFASGAMVILAGHAPMYAVLATTLYACGTAHGIPGAGIIGIIAMPIGYCVKYNRRSGIVNNRMCGAIKLTVHDKICIEGDISAGHNVNGNVGRNYRGSGNRNIGCNCYVILLCQIHITCKISRKFGRCGCKGCKRYYRQDHQSCKDKREKFSFHDNLLQIFFRAPLIGALFVYCCFSRYDRTLKNEICSL